jgi:hypothetical protein
MLEAAIMDEDLRCEDLGWYLFGLNNNEESNATNNGQSLQMLKKVQLNYSPPEAGGAS